MEETLDDLKRKLKNIASKISDKMNERQNYLDQAAEIQKIYDRMLQDKKTLKKYKSDIRTFYNKAYTDFKGNKFSYTYKPSIQELGNSYDAVISRIDTNLDALNTKKSEYNLWDHWNHPTIMLKQKFRIGRIKVRLYEQY